MALPTGYWWNLALKALVRILPLAITFLSFVAWFYNIVEKMVVIPLRTIKDNANSLDFGSFQSADFSTVLNISVINTMFPLSESLALFSAYFVIASIITVISWAKSFIPTVGN